MAAGQPMPWLEYSRVAGTDITARPMVSTPISSPRPRAGEPGTSPVPSEIALTTENSKPSTRDRQQDDTEHQVVVSAAPARAGRDHQCRPMATERRLPQTSVKRATDRVAINSPAPSRNVTADSPAGVSPNWSSNQLPKVTINV